MTGAKPKRKFQTGLQLIVGSAVLALVSIGGWGLYALIINREPDAITVRLLTVERGTVETRISESGTIELGGQQTLVSPAEGAVEQVLVRTGDRVNAGDVVITLRNPDRQTALSDQQLKIAQQEVTLARSRQLIIESREQLILDQQRQQSLQTGVDAGAIALSEVQEQETRVRNTLTTLRNAESEATKAELELRSLRLQLQRTQQQLQDTVITAPADGVVLGVSVNDGDGVDRRTELLTLGNPDIELVKLRLSTLNAAQVQTGQVARISVIGPAADIFTGRVVSLYPQAVTSSGDANSSGRSQDSGQATVPTVIQLDRPTQTLIPGGQVNAEIVLESRRNVITLAVEFVQRDGDDSFVWVVDANNRVQRQAVSVGLEGLTAVEIRSGLKVGDRVALPPPDITLEPGMLVTPEADIPPSDADDNVDI